MIDKGASNYNKAMNIAAKGGNIEIVKLMFNKGADDYNQAMARAIEYVHIEIVELLKSYIM